mmetsp:Transcript_5093/g.11581  ORF Transcript_5093/g.11581 Transcript_5093/m.11581 type:complete len:236 (+) Transcript_5093:360-1067(+)
MMKRFLLQTFLIRHTKSQRINGSEALSLPPSTTSTIMIKMPNYEDPAFNFINSSGSTLSKSIMNGCKVFAATGLLLPQMASVLSSGQSKKLMEVVSSNSVPSRRRFIPERLTKIVALRKDLAEHKRTEPQLRAVVYTQFVDVHGACVRGLEKDGFEVYQFTGSSNSMKRDAAIQNTAGSFCHHSSQWQCWDNSHCCISCTSPRALYRPRCRSPGCRSHTPPSMARDLSKVSIQRR